MLDVEVEVLGDADETVDTESVPVATLLARAESEDEELVVLLTAMDGVKRELDDGDLDALTQPVGDILPQEDTDGEVVLLLEAVSEIVAELLADLQPVPVTVKEAIADDEPVDV